MIEEVKVDSSSKDIRTGAVSPAFYPAAVASSDNSCKARPGGGLRRTTGPTRRSAKGGWTHEEDNILARAVKQFDGRNWKKIAEAFPGRSDVQCLHRWQKVLNPDLVKGSWTQQEDELIIKLVEKHGNKKWSIIAKSIPGRIGKQCRERWHNHLNPAIIKDAWTQHEELILIESHKIYGNKWAEIAKFLPGRADNSIKNHWNCSLKKRVGDFRQQSVFNLQNFTSEMGNIEADFSKKSELEYDDQFGSSANLDIQANSIGIKDLSLNSVHNSHSICSRSNIEKHDLEGHRCLHIKAKHIVGRGSNCTESELYKSETPRSFPADRRSCASSSTTLSYDNDANSLLPQQVSDLLHGVDSAHETSSNDHESDVVALSNFLCPENLSHVDISGENDLALRTPPQSSPNPSFQEGTTSSSDEYNRHYTPPSTCLSLASIPTSPRSLLRNAARTFKNPPSILRKRKSENSKELFADCGMETSKATNFADSSKPMENDTSMKGLPQSNKKHLVLFGKTYLPNVEQVSRSLNFDTSYRSIDKRLEEEFNKVSDA